MSQHSRFIRAEPAGARGAVFMLPAVSANTATIRAGVQQVEPELLAQMKEVTGLDIVEICRHNPEDLVNSSVTQPIVYLLGYAYGRVLESHGIAPIAIAGHSLGQYTALALSGAIDFLTGLSLVQARAEAIESVPAPPGSQMVKVLGLDADEAERLCAAAKLDARPTTIVAAQEVILSGADEALAELCGQLRAAGAERVILLMGSGVLHTPAMEAAAEAMRDALSQAPLASPSVPVASSTSGKIEDDPERWRELLSRELASPVRWHEAIAATPQEVPLLEVGTAGELAELALRNDSSRTVATIDSLEAVTRLDAALTEPAPA